MYSQTVYNGHPWDPKKRPLFRGGRYSEGPPIKLVWIWDVWGSGWPLLTGGGYSEVAVSTGMTVVYISKVNLRCTRQLFETNKTFY
jgi:hypothetical protein